jgi:hypothetical protein
VSGGAKSLGNNGENYFFGVSSCSWSLRGAILCIIFLFVLVFRLSSILAADEQISAKKMSLEEKVKNADMILVGTVSSVQSSWEKAESGKRIITRVRLSVCCYAKGAAGKELEIAVPGGVVDGIKQVNSDLPEFSAGEEVLLFLAGRPAHLMGGGEGKYLIKEGIILGLDLPIKELIGQIKKMTQSDFLNKRDEFNKGGGE